MPLKRKYLGQLLQIINSLSLDVALGAIAGSYILLFVAGIPSDGISILALAITVWLIYTLDHLLDAKEISGPAETFRHRIHQIYKVPLWSALVLFGFLFTCPNSPFSSESGPTHGFGTIIFCSHTLGVIQI